ncbi:unnamed protein product [Protopolystoma xenopodis]|uniref:Uncharacterized protein n=1 Tax=Protopolystoma xenopodis TaxID=117903 RepID=A0A448XF43_9PLAT|nr:unnamed protein product [Protopolystoma xenopodis]
MVGPDFVKMAADYGPLAAYTGLKCRHQIQYPLFSALLKMIHTWASSNPWDGCSLGGFSGTS